MRDGLLGLLQPLRDHPAHIVVRDDLVGAGLEQRADFLVGWRLNRSGGAAAGAGAAAEATAGA